MIDTGCEHGTIYQKLYQYTGSIKIVKYFWFFSKEVKETKLLAINNCLEDFGGVWYAKDQDIVNTLRFSCHQRAKILN